MTGIALLGQQGSWPTLQQGLQQLALGQQSVARAHLALINEALEVADGCKGDEEREELMAILLDVAHHARGLHQGMAALSQHIGEMHLVEDNR